MSGALCAEPEPEPAAEPEPEPESEPESEARHVRWRAMGASARVVCDPARGRALGAWSCGCSELEA